MNLKECLEKISSVNKAIENDIQKKLDFLTKPPGSLGVLEELAKKYCLIKETLSPNLKDKVVFTLAGDHGVVEEGVSAFPQEVTLQMVLNFINGGAGINVLAGHAGARVIVADLGVKDELVINSPVFKNKKIRKGTDNMVKGPAMTRDEAIRAIEAGIELVEEEMKNGLDIIGTGDMGIGNTTPSSAIVAAVTGRDVREITGRGTGIDDSGLETKIKVIEKALQVNMPDANDAIDILMKVGGFEIGGLAGVILAGAANNIPVVIDGFISGAAALIAYGLKPESVEYMIASHCSVEQGHKVVLEHLGLKPLVDFNLRLGEGTGAVIGISIVEMGVKILKEMATFESAGVSEKEEE
ncbi:MAG: nicotinate-nucleotide--dimethylbenzimidazole phosphoribosyltransferase [Elusimicrobiota bacterium]